MNAADGAAIVALDVIDDESLIEAGRLIWETPRRPGLRHRIQGLEYALSAYWRSVGLIRRSLPS